MTEQASQAPYQEEPEAFSEEQPAPSQTHDYFEEITSSPLYGAAEQLVKETAEYIRQKPIQASLISLGTGFLVGFLFHRKK